MRPDARAAIDRAPRGPATAPLGSERAARPPTPAAAGGPGRAVVGAVSRPGRDRHRVPAARRPHLPLRRVDGLRLPRLRRDRPGAPRAGRGLRLARLPERHPGRGQPGRSVERPAAVSGRPAPPDLPGLRRVRGDRASGRLGPGRAQASVRPVDRGRCPQQHNGRTDGLRREPEQSGARRRRRLRSAAPGGGAADRRGARLRPVAVPVPSDRARRGRLAAPRSDGRERARSGRPAVRGRDRGHVHTRRRPTGPGPPCGEDTERRSDQLREHPDRPPGRPESRRPAAGRLGRARWRHLRARLPRWRPARLRPEQGGDAAQARRLLRAGHAPARQLHRPQLPLPARPGRADHGLVHGRQLGGRPVRPGAGRRARQPVREAGSADDLGAHPRLRRDAGGGHLGDEGARSDPERPAVHVHGRHGARHGRVRVHRRPAAGRRPATRSRARRPG